MSTTTIAWERCNPTVIAHTLWNVGPLKKFFNAGCPRYIAAQNHGDLKAATAITERIFHARAGAAIEDMIGDEAPLIVSPSKQIQHRKNMLPTAYANMLASTLCLDIDTDIYEIKTHDQNRRSMDGKGRVSRPAQFAGAVAPGQRYLIVDDVCTTGGTIRSLAKYITERGGAVVGSTTLAYTPDEEDIAELANRSYISVQLPITSECRQGLTAKFGEKVDQCLKDNLGLGIDFLTDREGHALKSFASFGNLVTSIRKTGAITSATAPDATPGRTLG